MYTERGSGPLCVSVEEGIEMLRSSGAIFPDRDSEIGIVVEKKGKPGQFRFTTTIPYTDGQRLYLDKGEVIKACNRLKG